MSDVYCLICNRLKEKDHVCGRPLWTIEPYDWELIKKRIAHGPLELDTVWQDGKAIYVNLDREKQMKDFKISACNKCGERYPSAPPGTIHKCGKCSGYCEPIDNPSLEDILAVAQYDDRTVNTQPMEDWRKQVQPERTPVSHYKGRPLTELSREELIKACEDLGRQLTEKPRATLKDNNAQRPYQVYDFYERLHGTEDQTVDISTFLNRLADIPTVSGIVSISQNGESYQNGRRGWVTGYCVLFTHRHLPIDEEELRELGRAEP